MIWRLPIGLALLPALILSGCSGSSSSACSRICTWIASCYSSAGLTAPTCPFTKTCTAQEQCRIDCFDRSSCDAVTQKNMAAYQSLQSCLNQCGQGPDLGPGKEYSVLSEGNNPPSEGGPPPDLPLVPDMLSPAEGSTDTSSFHQLVITEIMPDPVAVSDNNGEWFEIYNPGSTAVDINGWTITDQVGTYQEKHTIAASSGSLTIAPGTYMVLGSNSDKITNGGVNVVYAYSAFYLANSADEIFLYDKQMKLVDKVEYDNTKSWPVPVGASLSLKNPIKDNNVAANWCTEVDSWAGSAGDKGSPGTAAGANCM